MCTNEQMSYGKVKLTAKKAAATMNAKVIRRKLAAFDFDHTIINKNSDTVVRDLLSSEKLKYDSKIGWTQYMSEIFEKLHAEHIQPSKIKDIVRCLPENPGFVRLLKRLHKVHDFDLIIISDSNSIFIEEWLKAHSLQECFTEVFTNPASFEENGLLKIRPYHHQTECLLSAENLCKGRVLERFVVERNLRFNIRYDRIIYVGDGNNDLCPVLRLRPIDFACVRSGYPLEKSLEKNRGKMNLNAELIIWENGFDLLEQLESIFKKEAGPADSSDSEELAAVTDDEIPNDFDNADNGQQPKDNFEI